MFAVGQHLYLEVLKIPKRQYSPVDKNDLPQVQPSRFTLGKSHSGLVFTLLIPTSEIILKVVSIRLLLVSSNRSASAARESV